MWRKHCKKDTLTTCEPLHTHEAVRVAPILQNEMNMLRPSRRQGHERISQQEDASIPTNTRPAVNIEGSHTADAAENEQNIPNAAAGQPENGGGSIDVDEENDLVLNANDDSEGVQENANEFSSNAAIGHERELRLRRQSTCTMLMLFFLVRLWIEAIIEKDVGEFMIWTCLAHSSPPARTLNVSAQD